MVKDKIKIVVALPESRYSCGQFAQPILSSPSLSKKVEFLYSEHKEQLEKLIGEAEILVTLSVKRETFLQAKKLKWIHLAVAGVDKTLFLEVLKSKVVITSSKGIHQVTVSEHVMGLVLAFAKGIAASIKAQPKKVWLQRELIDKRFNLEGKVLGIVGLGNIGLELARKAKAFDMKVIALKNSVKKVEKYKNVDLLLGKEKLKELLSQSDFVVILLPLTEETYHLISQKELGWMKKEAYLINVARGPIINEVDLISALKNKTIKGAGLDVVEREPLNSNSPLYDFENVIITPHIAGSMPDYYKRVGEIFKKNLIRYLERKPLLNSVDKKKGY
ncbi:MAG: D-2-hydroxyacid dehydrogenase [candidate division Zixibacteria bacterium]|nr:D-2-hydroxyacid dehydrogenase [candidate division Zixibacteria bacterium]